MMASSFDRSFFDDSQNGFTIDMDVTTDHAISSLKYCAREYKDKATEINMLLDKLGVGVNYLPLEIKRELKAILSDSEEFNFHSLDSKELLTVNIQHMMDSLCVVDDEAQVHRLKMQADSVVDALEATNTNLHRKLQIATLQSEYLEEKANELAAQSMVFRGKLEQAERELKVLQETSEVLEKPTYSLEDIHRFHKELKRVKENLALTGTKLDKYNQLSLKEKEAAKQLAKLQEELKNVTNEIKKKLNS
uniref:Uncharacterized protein n=1 Tax=Graphocephala atropunctata TaxID=36148 RepID=A0A1B6LWL2_9HEMI